MFKVGQKVIVKYGNETFEDYDNEYCYVEDMEELEGRIVTIARPHGRMENCYYIEEDDTNSYWHENWLIPASGKQEEIE